VAIREKEKQVMQERGIKLTYLPFVIKACTVALRRYPSFNAHFDSEKNELVAKKDINIGLAVDTPDGLMVIVIKDADTKPIADMAKEIDSLAGQAKERKIRLEDVRGSTFTITNIGSVGAVFSTPIINPPEVAIMGIHRIQDMPWAVDGQVKVRKIMGISMCFDHRVMDGAIATEFMNLVKRHLEDPYLLLMNMM
jgi:pyruvate dehydrogenase E2 component (dihydrolipoamide acetyltransferase)